MLFYLGSRGISKEEEERIIAKAKIDALCSLIADEAVRKRSRHIMADYKKDFPLLMNRSIAYLDNAATEQRPVSVLEAEKNFYEKYNANLCVDSMS